MPTPFRGDRLRALRELKGFRTQKALALQIGVRQDDVSNWECGKLEPDLARLKALKTALECTADYLIGESWTHTDDVREAASRMAFDIFVELPDVKLHQTWRERCEHVLGHEAAPVSVTGWRHLAEQIDLAVGSGPEGGRYRIVR